MLVFACGLLQGRSWTDQEGRSIEADVLKVRPDSVVLVMEDGSIYDVPFQALSEADVAFAQAYKPSEVGHISILESVYTIQNRWKGGNGTGFLMADDGVVYLYTNQHVIAGAEASDLLITNAAGDQLRVGPIEISAHLDLARIIVNKREGLRLAGEVHLEDEVRVFGNSQGAGVVTNNQGVVLGVGKDRVEVSAAIVPGNSGGPIINSYDEVVGISTFIKRDKKEDDEGDDEDKEDEQTQKNSGDWTTEGTRYGKTRRFGLNIVTQKQWLPVPWATYSRESRNLVHAQSIFKNYVEVAAQVVKRPFDRIRLKDFEDSDDCIEAMIHRHNDNVEQRKERTGKMVSGARRIRVMNDQEREITARMMRHSFDHAKARLERFSKQSHLNCPYFIEAHELEMQKLDYFHSVCMKAIDNMIFFELVNRD